MGIFNKKVRLTRIEAAQFMRGIAIDGCNIFIDKILTDLCEDLDIPITECNKTVIWNEAFIISMWSILYALQGDDAEFLSLIIEEFKYPFCQNSDLKEVDDLFTHRCHFYDKAWDNSSGSNQAIWATHVLAILFNGGKLDQMLSHGFAFFRVQSFFFNLMTNAVKTRAKIKKFDTLSS